MLFCPNCRFWFMGYGWIMNRTQDGIPVVYLSVKKMFIKIEIEGNSLKHGCPRFFKCPVSTEKRRGELWYFVYENILGIFGFDRIIIFNCLTKLKKLL